MCITPICGPSNALLILNVRQTTVILSSVTFQQDLLVRSEIFLESISRNNIPLKKYFVILTHAVFQTYCFLGLTRFKTLPLSFNGIDHVETFRLPI